jgi:putative transposase
VIASLTGHGFDVQTACLMLGVAPSGYYDWKARPPSARTLTRAWLAGEIAEVHKDPGGTYGTLRITAKLKYGRGIHAGKEQVHLLMRRLGIYSLSAPRLAELMFSLFVTGRRSSGGPKAADRVPVM